MKRSKLIVILMVGMFLLIGCDEADNSMNSNSYDEHTRTYTIDEIELLSISVKNGGLDYAEFEEMFTVECLRETHQGTYVILMREDGHKVFVFFGESGASTNIMIVDRFKSLTEFEEKVSERATLSEIQAFDSNAIRGANGDIFTIHVVQEGVIGLRYPVYGLIGDPVVDERNIIFYENTIIPTTNDSVIRDSVPYILPEDKMD